MAIYSPKVGEDGQNSFDITGSHFENLRIAGHEIKVKLATHRFHKYETHKLLDDEYKQGMAADDLLCRSKLSQLSQQVDLPGLEDKYHALEGLSKEAAEWKQKSQSRTQGNEAYWCSAANEMEKEAVLKGTELVAFGCFICIPKFGVVRLAELVIHKNCRILNMIRVQMCSSNDGSIDGSGTSGNGGKPMPPG
jgi:hypothetical protein